MNAQAAAPLRWNTSSYSATVDTTATDLSALGAHYRNCNGCKGRWFMIQCAVETVHAFVAPRFMTTLVAVGAVLTVLAIAL